MKSKLNLINKIIQKCSYCFKNLSHFITSFLAILVEVACPLYKWRLRHDVKARAWGVPDASHATRRSWRKCRALVLLCSACVMYSGLWCCREMIVSWQPRASWQLYRVRAMIPPNRTSPCSTCWRPSRTSGTAWTSSRTLADWVSTFSRKRSQPFCPSLTLLTRQ